MSKLLRTAALALVLGVAAPLAAHAADALRVVRDAATGELRAPNAAETLALEKADAQLRAHRAAARAAAGLPPARVSGVETRYADGTVETSLGEDTHMVSVVSTTADGTLQMDCLPAGQAAKLVATGKNVSRKPAARTGAAPTAKAAHVHQ